MNLLLWLIFGDLYYFYHVYPEEILPLLCHRRSTTEIFEEFIQKLSKVPENQLRIIFETGDIVQGF